MSGWKTDENGALVLNDGNPVWVDSEGSEMVVEAGTLTRIHAESKSHRAAKEEALTKLKAYEGIDDPEIARKALDTVKKLDAKKLIDAGEVDKLTDQIKQQFSAQMAEKDGALNGLQAKLDSMLIGDVFKSSEFVRDSLAVPRDMFEATFRSNFKVEEGKVVAYGKDGNRLLSKSRAGEYADADEALQLLVEAHPQKDVIIKAQTGSGSGNTGGGGNRGAGRVISSADFNKLQITNPQQAAEIAAKVGAGEMQFKD